MDSVVCMLKTNSPVIELLFLKELVLIGIHYPQSGRQTLKHCGSLKTNTNTVEFPALMLAIAI